MTHDQVREILATGDASPEAEAHLAGCAACRRWSEALARVRDAAPTLYAEAPAGLAGRTMTAVRAAAPVAIAAAAASRGAEAAQAAPSLWRRFGARAAIAAAVSGAVAVAAVTIPGGEPQTLVAAAASKTAAAQSARVEFSTSLTFIPVEPIRLPVPDVGRIRDGFRESLPPGLQARLGEALDRLPAPRPPAPIERIEVRAVGEGEVVFPDRLHLRGRFSSDAIEGERTDFESIQIGHRVWTRVPLFGDRWVAMPSLPVDIELDFHPGRLLQDLRTYTGNAQQVSETTIDGEPVIRYRFSHESNLGPVLGIRGVRIDAWIGTEDGLLRQLLVRDEGDAERGTLSAEANIRFSDFGIDATIEPPEPVVTIGEAIAGFFGFGYGVAGGSLSFSIEASANMPRFSFPEIRFPDLSIPEIWLPWFDFDLDFDLEIPMPQMPSFGFSFDGEMSVEGSRE